MPVAPAPVPIVERTRGTPLEVDFTNRPHAFTPSFDGSQRFSMWIETLRFADELERRRGKSVHFTYFINTCYYALGIEGSGIGRAESYDEVLVRRALTQQAINQGHEIGNHGVRHLDGTRWSTEEWRRELTEFHAVTDVSLFEPIRDEQGRAVFPRFAPLASSAPGEVGAECSKDADCRAGPCVRLPDGVSVCSAACNRFARCPAGTACGTPAFQEDTDVCLPRPVYPIVHRGETLFDAWGRPNLKHPDLVPYRIRGFRAPFLVFSDALVEALLERGYTYDASAVLPPGPPVLMRQADEGPALFELALMAYPEARTVPMDYNYDRIGAEMDVMLDDYRASLVASSERGRLPWSVGHHFARWRSGAYWSALAQAITFASEGCPGQDGRERCPGVQIMSFRELASTLPPVPDTPRVAPR